MAADGGNAADGGGAAGASAPPPDPPRSPLDDDPEAARAREEVARYLASRSLASLSEESNLGALVFGSDITRWAADDPDGAGGSGALLSASGTPLGLPASPLQLVWLPWESLARGLGAREDPSAPLYVLSVGEGVYTLDVGDRVVVLAFEARGSATEYLAEVAAALGTRDTRLVEVSVEVLRGTCKDEGRFLGIVPWASRVRPPTAEVQVQTP